MSWLSDLGENILGVTTDYNLDDQASWLKPVLNVGGSIYSQYQKNKGAQGALDAQRQSEQQNYDDALAEQQAYNNYVDEVNMYDWQNAQSRAAAAAQQDALRRRYAKKAAKKQREYYNEAKGIYLPYQQTGARLLPQMEGTYSGGLNNLNSLSKLTMSPESLAKLNSSKAAFEVGVPLPDYMRR